jgi:hypothetical protein
MRRLTPSERLELVRRKQRIESLLPLVLFRASPQRAQKIRRALARIDEMLEAPSEVNPEQMLRDPASAAGTTGIGALEFQVSAPPGVGRLLKLPMYPVQVPPAPAFVTTAAGPNLPSTRNPVVIAGLTGVVDTYVTQSGMQFQTPQIEWATVRIVGFQVNALPGAPQGAVNNASTRAILLVKNLSVGGGANLFPQEDYQDATVFLSQIPEYAGLRAYPVVQMPNQVTVNVAVAGQVPSFTTFSCVTVVEVLDDETFGRHIPGPYARRDALARRAPRHGTGFLT